MKVQCGQCPAKYAVADERVRDKKVRIHCKRCNAAIVVDGKVDPPLVTTTPARPSVGPARPSSAPESAPAAEPPQRPSPRPVAHTIMGGLEAPAAERLAEARAEADAKARRGRPTPPESPKIAFEPPRGKPSPDRGMTDPPSRGEPDRWRVALTQNDLRWMTTGEITEAYRAGAVQLESFVFRAGMPNWVTLMEVPELAQAVGQAGAALEDETTKFRARPPEREQPDSDTGGDAAGEPLPFALVAEKVAPLGGAQSSLPTPLVPPPATEEGRAAFEAAGAALGAKAEGGGSKAWVWVLVVLVVAGLAALFLAPRFGLKLR